MSLIEAVEEGCVCDFSNEKDRNISFEFCDFENPAHLATLAMLVDAYKADPMGDSPQLSKLQQLRLVDGLASHPKTLVVFVLWNNEVAGFSVCFENFSTFRVKSYLYVHDFFVLTKYRGKGIAKSMMQELLSISKERGYCKVTLEVREDNSVAKSLYNSFGFEASVPNMLFWTLTI